MNTDVLYGQSTLPTGIRSRIIEGVNGLDVHILEAGFASPDRPCILLLHGFPELAFSWRKILLPLAEAGYHVVAPDQRGYGRTTGWDPYYDGDLDSYHFMNLTKDALALVRALALTKVHGVVGHDFGSPVAAWCALIRPDVFGSVALMSAPFGGPPALPRGGQPAPSDMHEALAQLDRPRKHYQWYYTTPEANDDMLRCPQGVHDFLRAYYHHKSADWRGNKPYPLSAWSAPQLALMPTYYVMDKGETMATTVAAHMPTTQQIAACKWLTDEELSTYSSEYQRNGFQGGLQWYRCSTDVKRSADFQLFAGMTIDVPSCFIAGSSDWGVHQRPGAFETMQGSACTDMRAVHSLDGAGHWVQQEQPERVAGALLDFFAKLDS